MKVIIAGSRGLMIYTDFIEKVLCQFHIQDSVSEVVSGGCKGVDRAGELWAKSYPQSPKSVVVKVLKADWEAHGKSAGPIRNRQMAEYADALLLIWDGESRGSASMKREMERLKKPIYEIIIKEKVY